MSDPAIGLDTDGSVFFALFHLADVPSRKKRFYSTIRLVWGRFLSTCISDPAIGLDKNITSFLALLHFVDVLFAVDLDPQKKKNIKKNVYILWV